VKIYFAAHATTTDNEAKRASGWKDIELSELGKKQAKELGETFKNVKLDLICCSNLRRAVDTAKIAFGDSIPILIDFRLREINYGSFNGWPSEKVEPIKKKHIKEPFPNGESYEQAINRILGFYQWLKIAHPNKTILVIGHRATQYGLDIMNGKTIEELLNTPFKWQPYWEYEV